MAISRVGASVVEATSITIPGSLQVGDVALIFAYNTASTVSPTLPAGWTNLSTASIGTTAYRIGWRRLVTAADTSGTWTTASGLACSVYRGCATNHTPVGANGTARSASTTTISYANGASAVVLLEPNTSWVIGHAASTSLTSNIATPPTGMTNQASTIGALGQYVAHDTNGAYASDGSYPVVNLAAGGTIAYTSAITEIFADQGVTNNYQQFKVGDGMSTSEKIR